MCFSCARRSGHVRIEADFEEDPSDPADTVDPQWTNGAALSSRGDLWQLGHHRLLCGDARNADDLARLLGPARAAMAFLDPPYNVRVRDIVGRGQIKHCEFAMASGELSRTSFVEFLQQSLAAATAVSRDGAIHFVCMDWRHQWIAVARLEDILPEPCAGDRGH